MNADEVVKNLREMLPPQVDYVELVSSPVPSSYGICYVWEDPEPYHISAAIDLIESLQAQLAETRLERNMQEANKNHYKAQLAASQRRERAAVEDIMCNDHCDVCMHKDSGTSCE